MGREAAGTEGSPPLQERGAAGRWLRTRLQASDRLEWDEAVLSVYAPKMNDRRVDAQEK